MHNTMTLVELLENPPTSQARCVLSQWLNIRMLARLDVAYCNHKHRDRLVELLHNTEVSFLKDRVADPQLTLCRMRWLFARHMKCSSLSMTNCCRYPDEDVEFLHSYLQRAASYLKKLRFDGNLLALLTVVELLAVTVCALTHIDIESSDYFVSIGIPSSLLKNVIQNSAPVLQVFHTNITAGWQCIFGEHVYFPALVKISMRGARDWDYTASAELLQT